MKTYLLILLTTFSIIQASGQQDIQVSNFDYLSSYYNPASITSTSHICGNLIGRNQWSGLNGRPNTGIMNTSYNFSGIFWGNILLVNDVIGFQKSNLVKIGLAKSFLINQETRISFGMNFNYSHINWTSNFITPDTPVQDDYSIPNNDLTTNNFDMDAGIYISSKNLNIGISSTHLTEPTLLQPSFNFKHKRHYYVLCGYTLKRRIGDFENYLLSKSDGVSTQLDFKSNFWSSTGWMVGLAYRLSDAVIPMIGYQRTFNRINLRGIYSYDITTSKLNNYSSGSHEICLKICVAPMKFSERHSHPRHLGTWK